MLYVVLSITALIASIIAAVAGTGGAILLLSVMVAMFGVRDAVPMYAVAQLIGNVGRLTLNWRAIRLPVVGWFVLGAIPATVVGGVLFVSTPLTVLTRVLGAFLILSVVARHLFRHVLHGFRTPWFSAIGGTFGLVSALVGSAGPFVAPFFLAYGLTRSAFVGTEALGTAVTHVTKLATYGAAGATSGRAIAIGLALGPVMVLGAWIGRAVVGHMPAGLFVLLVEIIVMTCGFMFLLGMPAGV